MHAPSSLLCNNNIVQMDGGMFYNSQQSKIFKLSIQRSHTTCNSNDKTFVHHTMDSRSESLGNNEFMDCACDQQQQYKCTCVHGCAWVPVNRYSDHCKVRIACTCDYVLLLSLLTCNYIILEISNIILFPAWCLIDF